LLPNCKPKKQFANSVYKVSKIIIKNKNKIQRIYKNMPKQNPYLIKENYKKVEIVQELEKHEIKKSPLSSAARGKVINKSGSDYVSEGKDFYGPGNSQSSSSSGEREARRLMRYMGVQIRDMIVGEVINQFIGPELLFPMAGAQLGLSLGMRMRLENEGDNENLRRLSKNLASNGMSMLKFGGMELLDQLGGELFEKGLEKTGDFVKSAKEAYEKYDNSKPYFESVKHFAHLNEGKEYDSNCDVCRQ
jgi:hypothetical protein